MELPSPGELFESRYQIERVVGSGGFATVFAARDVEAGRDVALKVLKPTRGTYDQPTLKRFERELAVLERVHSPHIVSMLAHGRSRDGAPFVVFELLQGRELADVLTERGRLSPEEVEHVLTQLLRALQEAHKHGVLHRDLKPENVLVVPTAVDPLNVKLIDFGIARPLDDGSPAVTRTGELIGTPRYMSPEQLTNAPLTPASDLYSLGILAFEMALGREALHGGRWNDQIDRLVSGHQFALPEMERLGARLLPVVARMCARKPEGRYASAAQVLTALARGGAPPASTVAQPRRAGAAIPAAVVVAALALGVAVVLVKDDGEHASANYRGRPAGVPGALTGRPAVAATEAAPPAREADSRATNRERRRRGIRGFPINIYPTPERGTPLVVVMHSLSGDEPAGLGITNRERQTRDLAAEARLSEWADDGRAVVASIRVDGGEHLDPTVLDELVDTVDEEFGIDRGRLFLVGHGPAGREARLQRCLGGWSALATTGDGHRDEENYCPSPIPFLRIHATADAHVPVAGGPGCRERPQDVLTGRPPRQYLSAREVAEKWRAANSCSDESRPLEGFPGCTTWSGCEGAIAACGVPGGHDWPGTLPHPNEDVASPACKDPPMDYDVRGAVWAFFEAHGRRLDD